MSVGAGAGRGVKGGRRGRAVARGVGARRAEPAFGFGFRLPPVGDVEGWRRGRSGVGSGGGGGVGEDCSKVKVGGGGLVEWEWSGRGSI